MRTRRYSPTDDGEVITDSIYELNGTLVRIADTLDDYVDYALAAAKASQGITADPQGTLTALFKVVDEAIARRAER